LDRWLVDEAARIAVYAFYTALVLVWGPIYLFFLGSSALIIALRHFGILPTPVYSYILPILSTSFPLAILMTPVLGSAVAMMSTRRVYGVLAGSVMANMVVLIMNMLAWGAPALMMRIAAAVAAADLGFLFAVSYRHCRRS